MRIAGRRVVLPGGVREATVVVEDGRIAAIEGYAAAHDAGDVVIMPGVVDTHVHVNEPGRTEWEGFATATRAAAAGGATTLVDMPLNSVPATTTAAALRRKREAARGQTWVDVGFWGGVVPGNAGELAGLVAEGARGAKCFLVDSGVDEFPCVGADDLRPALAALQPLGVPLLVHAEVAGPIDAAAAALAGADPRRYDTYLRSRPPEAEREAIALVAALVAERPTPVHIVHHSAAPALAELRAARAAGLPISAETCPHYLALAAEEIDDGATSFKCAPPIRGRDNREELWRALAGGELEMVVSDHSPCTPALKVGDFAASWGGIAGLQLSLAVTWTEARARGHSLAELARWMCAAPARLAGLAGRKGVIAPGADADLVLWRPEERFVVDGRALAHRHKVTPYAGRELHGVVERTFVRGRLVHDRGAWSDAPQGDLI
jgi:allantoinase